MTEKSGLCIARSIAGLPRILESRYNELLIYD